MKGLRTLALVSGLVFFTGTAAADQHMRDMALCEVEVSLWELVASAMYHIGDPDAEGTILNGTDPGTRPTQEFEKQRGDVDQHWNTFKAEAGDADAAAITEFEAAYRVFLDEAERAMAISTQRDGMTPELQEQTLKMWVAAHRADDIIDSKLQPGNVR